MKNEALISIIVPVYNVESYLHESLDSIINQTHKNIEVIIVDDGSTDLSGEIVDKYAKKFSSFKVFHITNRGLSGARNYGLKKATGEYIFFLDPDDWIEKNLFEIAISNMIENNTNLFLMNFNFVNDEGKFISENRNVYSNLNKISSSEMVMKEILLNHIQSFVWQFVIRRNAIINNDTYHMFENVTYEDVIWTPRVIRYAKTISVSEQYFYNYRQRKHSIVHISTLKGVQDRLFGMDNFTNFIKKYYPQLQGLLSIWELASSIHLYAMCTTVKNHHSDVQKIKLIAEKNIRVNKNLSKLKKVDKVKYLLIRAHLFVPLTSITRRIKEMSN